LYILYLNFGCIISAVAKASSTRNASAKCQP
jgi:hypothetical protein